MTSFRGGSGGGGGGGVIRSLVDQGGYVDPNLLPINGNPNTFDMSKAEVWTQTYQPVQPWERTNVIEFFIREDLTPGQFFDLYNSRLVINFQFHPPIQQTNNQTFPHFPQQIQSLHPMCGGLMLFEQVEYEISGTVVRDESNHYGPYTAFAKTCFLRTQQKMPDINRSTYDRYDGSGNNTANVGADFAAHSITLPHDFGQQIICSPGTGDQIEPDEWRKYLLASWDWRRTEFMAYAQLAPLQTNPMLSQRKYVPCLFPQKIRFYKMAKPPGHAPDFAWATTDRDLTTTPYGLGFTVNSVELQMRRISVSAAGQAVWLQALMENGGKFEYPLFRAVTARFPVATNTTLIRETFQNTRKPHALFLHAVPTTYTDYSQIEERANPFTMTGVGLEERFIARRAFCQVGSVQYPKQRYQEVGFEGYPNFVTRKGGTSLLDYEVYRKMTLPAVTGATDGWQPFLSYDAYCHQDLSIQVFNLTQSESPFFHTTMPVPENGNVEISIDLLNQTTFPWTLFVTALYHEKLTLDPRVKSASLSY